MRLTGVFCQFAGLIIGLAVSIGVRSDTEFIRITHFLSDNPQQQALMEKFSNTVRLEPNPLIKSNAKPIKIAVIYPGIQSSDYWRRSLKTLRFRLDLLNVNYRLQTYFSRPGIDTHLQGKQLAEALIWEPDYLVFSADALEHRNTIQRVLLRGTPKLILQNITTPVKMWASTPPFLYTGFDHELGTQLLADKMLRHPESQYAMLFFSPGYVSQMRGGTFIREANKYPDIHQVASFYTGGNREKSTAATLKTLTRVPGLNMVFACSTDIALGVIDALDETDKHGQITVNGWGGGDSELQALLAGKLDLTVMRLNDDASVAMAEAIKLDISGQAHQVPQVYSGDMVLLDKTTTQEEILNHKMRAFRYSDD